MPTVIGQRVVRLDARQKVTGQSIYAGDKCLPGMLWLKVVRSNVPHAIIKRIDVKEACELPGVVAVFTAKDIPGINQIGIVVKDECVLAYDKVRQIGDPLTLIVAEDEGAAQRAAGLVKVEYEELPPVFDPIEAMQEGAPKIHEKGNILTVTRIKRGDIDKALKEADVVVSRTYKTPLLEHCYIETEAGVGWLEGDTIVVMVSTQNPHYDRKEIARVLGLPLNRVKVIQAYTGGGFGGKLDVSVQCYLGLAVYKLKRPVKMVYDRQESFIATPKRHPFIMHYTTAADRTGKLLGVRVQIIGDTGAYASYGPPTLKRAAVHATGPYEVPNVDIEAYCVYTNNPRAGAFRGFGVPQIAFAHESQMDILARELGLSPLEMRLRNAFKVGSITATRQELKGSVGIRETMLKAWEKAKEVMTEGKIESWLKSEA
ncbi:Aldehyde oxidase/xanthine dehydrogenase, a/b hammerhead [Moorella glycerini]|uniref:Nicotinate dehydrogenase large molybdopterin subunit n=1 Tax=Neomoorella stamsii TaxID=1266720 RepID=A0A9X7P6D7_9FIRM|nr:MULTISPECIES: molybdopterin cofactor-binding domain-containing protein [Moorella]PRR73417.1 Nicotinate dehydrogenase large molybdopterin subunit [Moorella stamsii]CEP69186.1 Aldehyde oxidase/xanthine dehydrogenase, a/b hammerhead [Moorella glycerini]